jgi:hypothetical protein
MNSSPNRASNPAGRPRRKDVSLDYATASQMLPLVRGIALDIVAAHKKLAELAPEQEKLDRNRRSLTWDMRQRRYAIADEIVGTEKVLAGAVSELDALGLRLADDGAGAVDFPTRINGRPAAFSWHLGEDRLGYWRYTGEELRRPIPSDWAPVAAGQFRQEP